MMVCSLESAVKVCILEMKLGYDCVHSLIPFGLWPAVRILALKTV